jgi:GTPase SAR1 family protein
MHYPRANLKVLLYVDCLRANHDMSFEAQVESQTVQITIVDTAGQEQYHSMVKYYIHDVDLVAICFDPSEPDWLTWTCKYASLAREIREDMPLIAIATKQDLWCAAISEAAIEESVQETLHINRLFVTSAESCYQVQRLKSELARICMDTRLAHEIPLPLPPKSQSCC